VWRSVRWGANYEWRMCDRGLNNTIRKRADPDVIPQSIQDQNCLRRVDSGSS
jgi:hypothetical protein